MINFYDIKIDKNGIPKLDIIKQIECSNKDLSIEKIVEILNKYEDFENLYSEQLYAVSTNNNNDCLGIYLCSKGDSDRCNLYKKEVLIFLLLTGANNVLLFHNHPSDILQPSENDKKSYGTLEVLTNLLGITLTDSVIVCRSGWYCIKNCKGDYYEDDEDDEDEI